MVEYHRQRDLLCFQVFVTRSFMAPHLRQVLDIFLMFQGDRNLGRSFSNANFDLRAAQRRECFSLGAHEHPMQRACCVLGSGLEVGDTNRNRTGCLKEPVI